jgi:hypothetical protein
MGANAQTSVPLFSSGEVLTAANQNISAGTGVPVFATTTTRDAAFGGTGEKVLAEGQLCYIEASDVVQYYDGATWATVGPASPGALAVVKAETSFSAVASVTADNVFTSTYTNYLLTIRASTTGNDVLNLRLRASASSAATNYNYQQAQFDSGTSYVSRSTSQTSFQVLNATNGATAFTSVWLSGPQLAALTNIGTNQIHNYTSSTPAVAFYYGNHSTATSYDGFELLTVGTTTGTYTVYGYAKS